MNNTLRTKSSNNRIVSAGRGNSHPALAATWKPSAINDPPSAHDSVTHRLDAPGEIRTTISGYLAETGWHWGQIPKNSNLWLTDLNPFRTAISSSS